MPLPEWWRDAYCMIKKNGGGGTEAIVGLTQNSVYVIWVTLNNSEFQRSILFQWKSLKFIWGA